MFKLNELIENIDPKILEYKEIGELLEYIQPQKYIVNSTNYELDGLPVLTPGQSFILGYTKETEGIYKASQSNPCIIFDDFTTSFHWVDFDFKVKSSAMKILVPKERINFRYIYHYMKTIKIDTSSHGRQWISKYSKIIIAIPSLAIQDEIVRILDNFAELTAELIREQNLRKQQYEYYREKLLGEFNSNFESKMISEVAIFMNGKGHEKAIVEDGKYIVVNSKFVSSEGKVFKTADSLLVPLYQNDVLMVMSDLPNGKALAKTFFVEENDKYTLNQRICCLRAIENKILPKFLYYIVNRNSGLLAYDNKVDQTNLKKADITDLYIPVPSVEEQQRIVEILDRFDTLANDINSGLPAEIKLRQQQYEYYRDKLLTFKEKE
ncbi:MAG: restriction endonuclease subunit S [bacterium]